MSILQQKGYIEAEIDLNQFIEKLLQKDLIRRSNNGGLQLTDRGIQNLRQSSLDKIFQDIQHGKSTGEHRNKRDIGKSHESLPETRAYHFGDELNDIQLTESLWNSIKRTGGLDLPLHEHDLVVEECEKSTSCATVLLLDISHSMILYGEDRFSPAKQVALALTELILTRYKKDTLDIVLFGNEAIPVPIKKLPFASVGPYHTNTKAGLAFARKILERRKSQYKQIFMVTDGKPTVIHLPGGEIYRNTFGADEKILRRTLDEAVLCRRKNIPITTFMVTRDPYLEDFVHRLTELNQGRAYFSDSNHLGGFILKDFLRRRQSKA